MISLGAVAVAAAALLAAGLLTWAPAAPEPARALTAAEAERFAAVRVTNHRDVRSGVRVTVGDAAARIDAVGWVDWSRPLAYLDVGGPGAGPDRGLLQAVPGLLMARPDPGAVPAPAFPPLVPPADGWRVAAPGAARSLRPALDLLFALAAPRTEPAGAVPDGAGRWLARAEVGGQPVDVLQAPLPGDDDRRRDDRPHPPAPTRTAEPTRTPAPARTANPTRRPAPTRTAEPARTPAPARTAAPTHPRASVRAAGPTRAAAPARTAGRSGTGARAGDATPSLAAVPSSGPTRTDWPAPVASLPAAVATPGAARLLGGAARWWVDRDARLHRLQGRLAGGAPVTLELHRANRPVLWPVAALGGRAGLPRALTGPEEDRLGRLAGRMRARGGAAVTLAAPVAPGEALRGAGWVSWTARAAYLSAGAPDAPPGRTLRRYDPTGVWIAPAAGNPAAPPPLPPPRAGHAWRRGTPGADDVDRLLAAALRVGDATAPRSATRIRGDRLADRAVDVVEVETGHGRVRYWIDRVGQLRRLELRTRLGTYARLDLAPGPVQAMPPPVTAPKPRAPR
ncbi:hypothetical protein [Micromonospora okii]|uniref:hypothetical protein n=1 Tax=Micromonospora okii TaxID=1182970 RepID=UPI0027952A72|nr:hypothetical protein [Micromonospora okii]